MYAPDSFAAPSETAAQDLIDAHRFALLVSVRDGAPFATHIPFLLDRSRGAHGTLLGHVARANPHWQAFADGPAMAVFQGPHAYVSPRWYAAVEKVVPTWNYAAVHAYGAPRLIEDPAAVRAYLDRLVASEEDGAWTLDGQPAPFVDAMLRALVAFELPIDRLEAKFKLSQNRPAEDHGRVVAALEDAGDEASLALARLMRR